MKHLWNIVLIVVLGAVPSLLISTSGTADARQVEGIEPLTTVDIAGMAQLGADFVPLTPSRTLDTRTGVGVESAGPIGPSETIDLAVRGVGSVPATGVEGVVFNLTATAPTARTFVNAWPSGEPEPATAMLNVEAGAVFANLVVAKLGADGGVSLSNEFGQVHLLVDVVGWIPTGSNVVTVTPARVLDTRSGVGAPAAQLGPEGQIDLDVVGVGGVPATGVDAVWLKLAATGATASSFITVWPTGDTQPTTSVLNMNNPAPVPNLVLAKVSNSGQVSLFNGAGRTHLIADVVGYTKTGAVVVPLTPERVLDTRTGLGANQGKVDPDSTIDVTMLGVGGIPEIGPTAVIINVTAVAPTERSFVTTWPTGLPRPDASSLNMLPGQNVANLVVAPVGPDGKVNLYNEAGLTHLLADVVGYVIADDDPEDTDFDVEVIRHSYAVGFEIGAADKFHDYNSGQRGPTQNGSLEEYDSVSIDGDRTGGPADIGPYPDELLAWGRGIGSLVSADESTASASASLDVDYATTSTSWRWDVTASATAAASGDDADASVSSTTDITVSVSAPSVLTITPTCPTISFGITDVSSFEPVLPGECYDPAVLPAGDYRFNLGAGSGQLDGEGNESFDASGEVVVTLTAT